MARRLPSPWLVYLAALGERSALRAAVEEARAWEPNGKHLYMNRFALEWSLRVERMVGRAEGGDAWRWASWRAEARVLDAVFDEGDWLPGVVDAVSQLWSLASDPRAVLRKAVRGA